MSKMRDGLVGRRIFGVLVGTAVIGLFTGCGDSMFGTFRSMPAPLRTDFPYELLGRQWGYCSSDSGQFLVDGTTHCLVLQGVDAPKPGQPCSAEAQNEMRRLIGKQPVRIVVVGRDSHEREIGFVFVANSSPDEASSLANNEPIGAQSVSEIDAGHELIRLGLGWYDGNDFDDADSCQQAEQDAREVGLGLWIDDLPVPPSR